jgi:GT2 family glycosyltransferase
MPRRVASACSTMPPETVAEPSTVSAIVVACDSGETLGRCVDALAAAGVGEIVVVDNASTDGACEALPTAIRNVPIRVLRQASNLGFGAAVNLAAGEARGDWLAIVNPDCFVAPDTFIRLLETAARCPDVGILGADVRDARGRPEPAARRRDPSLARILAERLLPARWRGDRGVTMPQGREGSIHVVDAVSGALMLLPRAVFESLGGFDPAYRLHAEDLDLCRRVRLAGHRVIVAEGVVVTHLKGTSSARRPFFVAWHKHRGLMRYLGRYGGSGRRLAQALVAIVFVVAMPWYAVRGLLAGEFRRRPRAR